MGADEVIIDEEVGEGEGAAAADAAAADAAAADAAAADATDDDAVDVVEPTREFSELLSYAVARGIDLVSWFAPPSGWKEAGDYRVSREEFERKLMGLGVGLGAGLGDEAAAEIEQALSRPSVNRALAVGRLSLIHISEPTRPY